LTPQPEQQARDAIDRLLQQAGWQVCNATEANITGYRGVAIYEFPCRATASPTICTQAARYCEARRSPAALSFDPRNATMNPHDQ